MLLHDFLHLSYNYEDLINYLCDMEVMRRDVMCPRCKWCVRGRKKIRKVCNFTISPFQGTWFANSHLGLQKTCRFIGYFLMMRPPRQHFLEEQLQMSSESVVDWSNFCRELLAQWMKQENDMLGGRDVIVEVDEAKVDRRKYNRGRIIGGQWVFGALERSSKRFFIVPVKNRTAQTLTKIIEERIAPGSIIYSDSWKGYLPLKELDYVHQTVNHSVHFVDPESGVHTQNIEQLWRDMRSALP
ncbi:hypothetical protein ALC62_14052 [Cyphomyrmex costatus]|uniref:ISXO2-like transposase domain-containing protein n=1 Tax=Cyphomyrmex costatus TaxID=456900 RepID=A0A151I927_9HYME|nr:hypothetical protein ALC62_14052 [Cyphomyrmex costatus]